MEKTTITITLEEYRDLVEKAERLATAERFILTNEYTTVGEIKAILGI